METTTPLYVVQTNNREIVPFTVSVVDDYVQWVGVDMFLTFRYKKKKKDFSKFKFLKASKRGNDVYVERTKERFREKLAHVPDYEYFSKRDKGVQRTDIVFFTLTYEKQTFDNWIEVGKHFQDFMNHIRKTYDGVEFIRVWESHQSGTPHIHGVLRLPKGVYCRKIKNKWRVIGKEFRQLKGYWTHGFSDFVALSSTNEMYWYLIKYITKAWSEEGQKHLLTLACLWHFRKHSFSFSKKFYDDAKSPKGSDLITTVRISYRDQFYEFEFMGCMTKEACEQLEKEIHNHEIWEQRVRQREHMYDGLEKWI